MVKLIIGILIAIVLVVFIAQNTMVVDINFIAWKLSVSQALLVLIILIFGVTLGFVLTQIAVVRKSLLKKMKEKKLKAEEKAEREQAERKQADQDQKEEAKQTRRERKKK